MSDFHVGDRVYVRPIGTIGTVSGIATVDQVGGHVSVIGYYVSGVFPETVVFSADRLTLVLGGSTRAELGKWRREQGPQ